MCAETILRDKGMRILIRNLGIVEAGRFIALIMREPFDYTKWQESLFDKMSVRELSDAAMEEYLE